MTKAFPGVSHRKLTSSYTVRNDLIVSVLPSTLIAGSLGWKPCFIEFLYEACSGVLECCC